MGLGGNGGREEVARENLELKASDQNFCSTLFTHISHTSKGKDWRDILALLLYNSKGA